MSKITLEITEVVNGVSITETPITLQGDLLAAASTTATGVTFTPTGGIAATNVQTALAELDSEKVSTAGGAAAVTFNATGGISANNVQAAIAELDTEKLNLSGGTIAGDFTLQGNNISKTIRWDQSENLLKVSDGTTIGFGIGTGLADIDLEIFHVSNQSYIRDTGAGTLFIQTDGPSITLGGTAHNNIVSGKFIPGAEVTLYHNSSAKITTTANGVDVTGLVEFDSLSGTGAVAITDILDADDMSGASATTLSTSESIKAYVDNQVAGKDNTDEITEGSNLYFTNARADARIAAATTTDLTEGTQLYFTNTRADARIAANLIDEDGFGTNSATRAPSQQSVKAYVAAQTANIQGDITNVVAGNGLSGGGTSGLVTLGVDLTFVATTGNTLSMNNKTLNSPVLNSPDINGGTVDGVVIGGSTAAAGNFTTLGVTGGLNSGDITITDATPAIWLIDSDGTNVITQMTQAGNTFVTTVRDGTSHGRIDFKSNDGTNSLRRLLIDSDGDFNFYKNDGTTVGVKWDAPNGRLGIGTTSPTQALDVVGSIKTTNGIVFVDASATGTASANTLDAYEEGSWDPVVRDATTGGNAATMQAATGYYTLIGNQCTLVGRFINIDPDAGSPSAPTGGNTIHITGLPFAPANFPTGVRHIGSMESTSITYQNSIQPRILENANYIVISNSQNNGSLSTLDFDALNSSAADIFLQVTYTV